jgi:hypothetical protein
VWRATVSAAMQPLANELDETVIPDNGCQDGAAECRRMANADDLESVSLP